MGLVLLEEQVAFRIVDLEFPLLVGGASSLFCWAMILDWVTLLPLAS